MSDTFSESSKLEFLPFAFLFEETAPPDPGLFKPIYDPWSKISFVENEDGELHPFVELRPDQVSSEELENSIQSTSTVTEVRREVTDTDPAHVRRTSVHSNRERSLASTETVTFNSREMTDRDQSKIRSRNGQSKDFVKMQAILEATGTETKSPRENTDRD